MRRTFTVHVTLEGDLPPFVEEVEGLIEAQMDGELSESENGLRCTKVEVTDWTEEF